MMIYDDVDDDGDDHNALSTTFRKRWHGMANQKDN